MSDEEAASAIYIAMASDRYLERIPTKKIRDPIERDAMRRDFSNRLVAVLTAGNTRFYRGPPTPIAQGGNWAMAAPGVRRADK